MGDQAEEHGGGPGAGIRAGEDQVGATWGARAGSWGNTGESRGDQVGTRVETRVETRMGPGAASSAAKRSSEGGAASAWVGGAAISAGSGSPPTPINVSQLRVRLHPEANTTNFPRVKTMLWNQYGITMTLNQRKGSMVTILCEF